MKKVLILGSKGTLGQALVKDFTAHNYEVTAWDKDEADITSPEINEKISDLHPDILINAIGYNALDKAEVDENEKKLCFLLNAEIPGQLAELTKKLGIIFVYYSTDYVFKGDNQEGYKEEDTPDPQSVYGQSKYQGENNIKKLADKYYLIRPSRIFGIKGESINSKKSFVEIMLEKQHDPELKVKNEEKGSPTYAPDLAKFTRELIESASPWGIYHGTNKGACNWYEWATEIFKLIGKRPNMIAVTSAEFPTPAKRPKFSELLNTKRPLQRSWQDALKEFLNSQNS